MQVQRIKEGEKKGNEKDPSGGSDVRLISHDGSPKGDSGHFVLAIRHSSKHLWIDATMLLLFIALLVQGPSEGAAVSLSPGVPIDTP